MGAERNARTLQPAEMKADLAAAIASQVFILALSALPLFFYSVIPACEPGACASLCEASHRRCVFISRAGYV